MLTFGRRGLFATRDDCLVAWARFARSAGRLLGHYCGVIELKNGGYHLHVAVKGWQPLVAMRRLWYRSLGGTGDERGQDTPGSLNVKMFGARGGRGVAAPRAIAGYIAKYIGKDAGALPPCRKAYFTSRGIAAPEVRRFVMPHTLGPSGGLARVHHMLEHEYERMFHRSGVFYFDGVSGCKYWTIDDPPPGRAAASRVDTRRPPDIP